MSTNTSLTKTEFSPCSMPPLPQGVKLWQNLWDRGTEEDAKKSLQSALRVSGVVYDKESGPQSPSDTIGQPFVVQFENANFGSTTTKFAFAAFPDVTSYFQWSASVPSGLLTCRETVRGARKPYFDIDIDSQAKVMKDGLELQASDFHADLCHLLLETIYDTLTSFDVTIEPTTDLLAFSSHGKSKFSYHIVVDGLYFLDGNQARAFRDHCVFSLPEEYHQFVDHGVYSKTQQFRIVGAQKENSGRPKILCEPLIHCFKNGDPLSHACRAPSRSPEALGYPSEEELLRASLLGCIEGCVPVPAIADFTNQSPELAGGGDTLFLTCTNQERVASNLNSVSHALNACGHFPTNTFAIGVPIGKNGSLVPLSTRLPWQCFICMRVHQHENPFVTLTNGGDVNFHCRRAVGNKTKCIGVLRTLLPQPKLPAEHVGTHSGAQQTNQQEDTANNNVGIKRALEDDYLDVEAADMSIFDFCGIPPKRKRIAPPTLRDINSTLSRPISFADVLNRE